MFGAISGGTRSARKCVSAKIIYVRMHMNWNKSACKACNSARKEHRMEEIGLGALRFRGILPNENIARDFAIWPWEAPLRGKFPFLRNYF